MFVLLKVRDWRLKIKYILSNPKFERQIEYFEKSPYFAVFRLPKYEQDYVLVEVINFNVKF